jgi:isochorismate synthase
MVARAIAAIDKGELVKVVLARHVDVIMSKAIRVDDLLRRWSRLEPNCTIFSLPTAEGQFVGASPELLVERSGTDIHSRPLAGTTDRFRGDGGSALPVELLESAKDSAEHRLVVDAIERALRPFTSTLDVPTEPDLVHLHNITHLGTSIIGRLAGGTDDDVPSVLALVAALHPTPAVGGEPVASARAMIARSEPQSRGSYAGPVGYVDAAGDGMWVVGIRAMTIRGRTARLSAGVGIVDGSEPSTELAEANLKFTAVFDALAPGAPFSTSDRAGTDAGPRAAVG